MEKKRLDILLYEKALVESREKGKAFIMEGKVFVNNVKITKAGTRFTEKDSIEIRGLQKYVSRGGLKLEHAVKKFGINIKNKICMDIGASTGGFTDCLLQNGAAKVYAVDVGYGQLHWKLRNNNRVIVLERENFRTMEREKIPDIIHLSVIDVSFISLKLIVPKVSDFLSEKGEIIALIKPQLEAGKKHVGKGGIVKDPEIHKQVINSLSSFFSQIGLQIENITESPLLGQKGNKEFLIHMLKK
jgi:23S rRNA (cytidine1920-2'-O)/16S rRNA (cytidine1409-2'-O)-methyltransferase